MESRLIISETNASVRASGTAKVGGLHAGSLNSLPHAIDGFDEDQIRGE